MGRSLFRNLLSLLVPLMLCQAALTAVDPQDQPLRTRYVEGEVGVQGSRGGWTPGTANRPLWAGDRLALEKESRVELESGGGDRVWLAGPAEVRFAGTEAGMELIGSQGELVVSSESPSPIVVGSRRVRIYSRPDGLFRVRILRGGGVTVWVLSGALRIVWPEGTSRLAAGDSLMAGFGSGSGPAAAGIGPSPGFLDWVEARRALGTEVEPDLERGPARGGFEEELAAFGRWESLPLHGWVWWPQVPESWHPYARGLWEPGPGGRSFWVSREPWGWHPYRRGTWIFLASRSRWCWVPEGVGRGGLTGGRAGPGSGWLPAGIGRKGPRSRSSEGGSEIRGGRGPRPPGAGFPGEKSHRRRAPGRSFRKPPAGGAGFGLLTGPGIRDRDDRVRFRILRPGEAGERDRSAPGRPGESRTERPRVRPGSGGASSRFQARPSEGPSVRFRAGSSSSR